MDQGEVHDIVDEHDKVTITMEITQPMEGQTITIHESPMDTSAPAIEVEGVFSYENAVKLGLLDPNTGKFRNPLTGNVMSLDEALDRGFIDPKTAAVRDISSGATLSLDEAVSRKIIVDGKLDTRKAANLDLVLDPRFTRKQRELSPMNFEDAVLSGLLDLESCQMRHPKTGEVMTLQKAVDERVIDGESVTIMDPTTGEKLYLREALERRLVDPSSSQLVDTKSGERLLALTTALTSGLIESRYKVDSAQIKDKEDEPLDLKQAIKEGVVDRQTPAVFDSQTGRRLSIDDAIRKGIVDKDTLEVRDPKTGRKITAKEAAKLGLLAVVGAPVLASMGIAKAIKKATQINVDTKTTADKQATMHERIIEDYHHGAQQPSIQQKPAPPPVMPKPRLSDSAPRSPTPEKRPSTSHEEDIEPKRRAQEAKSSDSSTEVTPVAIKVQDGQISASQTVTTRTETKEYKEQLLETKATAKPKPAIEDTTDYSSPATIEYHEPPKRDVIEEGYESIATTEYHTAPEEPESEESEEEPVIEIKPPLDLDMTAFEKVPEVSLAVVTTQQQPAVSQQDKGLVSMTATTVVTETRQRKQKTEHESFGPSDEEDTVRRRKDSGSDSGTIRDRKTGNRISMADAIERGLVQIDWENGIITDSYTKEKLTPEQAFQQGLIDSHIKELIETRVLQSRQTIQGKVTLNEAATRGLLIVPLGRIRNPNTATRMTIEEAIDIGFLNANLSIIINPATGVTMTLTQAIQQGILDPHSGDVKNTATGKTMTLTEVTLEGLIPEHGLSRPDAILLSAAIQEGYVNVKTGEFTHPETGQVMEIEVAIQLGYIESTETETSISVHERTVTRLSGSNAQDTSRMTAKTLPSAHTSMPLDEAADQGLITEGMFRDPRTGQIISLTQAIAYGYIKAPATEGVDLETDGIDFEEAMRQGLIDVKNNTFTEPITQVLMPLDAAIRKGFVILPEGGISVEIREQVDEELTKTHQEVTAITEERTSTRQTSRQLTYDEAVQRGVVDPNTETYTDTQTGNRMSVKDAAKMGLLAVVGAPILAGMAVAGAVKKGVEKVKSSSSTDKDNILEFTKTVETTSSVDSADEHGMSMAAAMDSSHFNSRNGKFTDQNTGRSMSLDEAIGRGLIDARSAHTVDQSTGNTMNLRSAIDAGILDGNGKMQDPRTGSTLNFHDALLKGLVTTVDIQSSVKTKRTVCKERIKLAVDEVVDQRDNTPLSLKQAKLRGVITDDKYVTPTKAVPIHMAYDDGYIKGTVLDCVKSKEEFVTSGSSLASSLLPSTQVIDPSTEKPIPLEEAKRKGIIDGDKYRDPRTGETMVLNDAVEAGLVITTETVTSTKTIHKTEIDASSSSTTVNIMGVIDPRSGKELSVMEGIEAGILRDRTSHYVHLVTQEVLTVEEAIRRGLLITDRPIKSQEVIPVETRTFSIGSVLDPQTNKFITPDEASERGILDMSREAYINTATGEVVTLEQAMLRGLISAQEGVDIERVTTIETKTRHEKQAFSIQTVIDISTNERLHPQEAIDRNLLNLNKGTYIHPVTGEAIPLHEALQRGYIIATETDVAEGEPVAKTAVLETRAYTIRYVIDTQTSQTLTVKEAIKMGILDKEICKYWDRRTNESMSIRDAITKGFIIVDESEGHDTTSVLQQTKSYTLKSVIDPKTGEEIPISDAVRHQIVDKVKGIYWNTQTDERISIEEAIKRGLVISEPVQSAGKKDALVELDTRKAAKIYSLKSVRDSRTGEEFDPIEAERRGLINKAQGIYMNPITGEKMSIRDAIRKGLIVAEELEDPDYDDLPTDATIYATLEAVRASETMNVNMVTDTRTGEQITIMEAVRRGILDPTTGQYVDKKSGNKMTLNQAIDSNFVSAQVHAEESTVYSQSPKLAETFTIATVLRPDTGEKMNVKDAIDAGLLDMDNNCLVNPQTGQRIPLNDAAAMGLVISEESLRTSSQKVDSVEYTSTTTGTFISRDTVDSARTSAQVPPDREPVRQVQQPRVQQPAAQQPAAQQPTEDGILYSEALEHGLVDESSGMFYDPDTGAPMPIEEAIKRGILSADIPVTLEKESKTEIVTRRTESKMTYGFDQIQSELLRSQTRQVTDGQNGSGPDGSAPGTNGSAPAGNGHVERDLTRDGTDTRKPGADRSKDSPDSPYDRRSTERTPDDRTSPAKSDISKTSDLSVKEAIDKGMVDMITKEYIDPNTRERTPLREAIDAGVVEPEQTGTKLTLEEAVVRGIVDPDTGMYRTPDGRTITVDEAILSGLLQWTKPTRKPSPEVQRKSMSYSEALQEGLIDTALGTYVDLESGMSMELSEAMKKGFLQPRIEQTPAKEIILKQGVEVTKSRPSDQKAKDGTHTVETKDYEFTSVTKTIKDQEEEEQGQNGSGYHDYANGNGVPVDEQSTTSTTDEYFSGVSSSPVSSIYDRVSTAQSSALVEVSALNTTPTSSISLSVVSDSSVTVSGSGSLHPLLSSSSYTELHAGNTHFFQAKFEQVAQEKPLEPEAESLSSSTEPMEASSESIRTASEDSIHADLPPLRITEGSTDDFKPASLKKRKEDAEKTKEKSPSPSSDAMSMIEALDSGSFDSSTGKFEDPYTGKEMSFLEAVDKQLLNLQVNKVQNPATGEVMTLQQAVDQGLIDTKTGQLIDVSTGRRYSMNAALEKGFLQDSAATLPTLDELTEQGLYDPDSGTVSDNGRPVPLLDAIEQGLVDKNTVRIHDPRSGDTIALNEAFERGVMNAETGQVVDRSTGKAMSFAESVKRGLLAVAVAPIAAPILLKQKVEEYLDNREKKDKDVTLGEAIDQGLVSRDNLKVKDPQSGREMDLNEAVRSGVVDPNTGEYIDTRSGQSISFQQAVESGLLTTASQPTRPTEQEKAKKPEKPLDQSVEREDFLDAPDDEQDLSRAKEGSMAFMDMIDGGELGNKVLRDPVSGTTISLEEAIERGILDPDTGSVVHSQTGQVLSFQEALDSNLVVESTGQYQQRPEKPSDEDMDESLESMSLVDAITGGFYEPSENTVTDPKTGRTMTISEALDCGLIVMDNTMVVDHSSGQEVSLGNLLKLGLVDLNNGIIRDSTGADIPLEDAVKDELLFEAKAPSAPLSMLRIFDEDLYDPETGHFFDPVTNEAITMKDAIDRNIFDVNSVVFNDPGSGEVLSLPESIQEGLVDTKRGLIKDTASKEKVPLTEALDRSILIPRPMSIATAVDIGLFNEATQKFLDPCCRLFFGLEEAIDGGLIDSESAIFDPSSGQQLNLAKATAIGVLDARNGNVVNVHTGETISLKEAVELGKMAMQVQQGVSLNEAVSSDMYDPKTNTVTDPSTKKTMSLEDAIASGVIDPESYIKDPATGDNLSLLEAVEEGVLNLQTGQVQNLNTGSTETMSTSAFPKPLTLEEAVKQKLFKRDGSNKLVDPVTKKELTVEQAIRSGLLEADVSVKDPVSGQNVPLADAVDQGMVDLAAGLVFNSTTGEVTKITDSKPTMSLEEAVQKGFYNPETNTVVDPITKAEMGLDEALELDIIDPQSQVRDPHTGNVSSVRDCIERGVLDPNLGIMIDTNTGQSMTIADMLQKPAAERPESVSLIDAIERGVVDGTSGQVQDPHTGETVGLEEAMERGIINGDHIAVLDNGRYITLREAFDRGIVNPDTGGMEDPESGKMIPLTVALAKGLAVQGDTLPQEVETPTSLTLAEAIDKGLYDTDSGTLTDPHSGHEMTLIEAMKTGLIDGKETEICVPGTDDVMSLDDAVKQGIVDPLSGTVYNQQTGSAESLTGALVDSEPEDKPEDKSQPSQASRPKELQVPLFAQTRDSVNLNEVVEEGLFDAVTGTILSPTSGQQVTIMEAIKTGLIDAKETTVVIGGETTNLEEAIQQGSVDPLSGTFTDPVTGKVSSIEDILKETTQETKTTPKKLSVSDAVSAGIMNPEDGSVKDPTTGKELTLIEAVKTGIIDGAQTITIPGAETTTLSQAIQDGIVDPFSGTVTDPSTGDSLAWTDITTQGLNFQQAISSGVLDPKTGIVDYKGEEMTLEDAVNRNIIDISNTFVPRQDGTEICLKDALDAGLLEIDGGALIDPLSGKDLTVQEALDKGLVSVANTPIDETADRKSPSGVSMADVIGRGLFDEDSGLITDPSSGRQMTIRQAVDSGVVNADTIQIKDPESGDLLTFEEAMESGVIDPTTGDILSPEGENLTLKEAVHSGLAIVATDATGLSLQDAVQQGLYDPETGLITDPTDGRQLTLKQAIDAGILDATKSTVRDYYSGEVLSIESAVENGLIDLNAGTMEDPVSGKPINLGEAIVRDLLTTSPTRSMEARSPIEGEPDEVSEKIAPTKPMKRPHDESSDSGESADVASEEEVAPPQSQGLAMSVDQGLIQEGK